MNDRPLISVIVPIYKVEPWVERCVQSVLGQTLRDVELIMVDDCTPDRSMELARQAADSSGVADIAVVCLRHESNAGLSVARNTGIEAARGRWVYFLDSDDYLPADALEQLYAPIAAGARCDFVVGNYENLGDATEGRDPLCLPEGVYQQPDVLNTLSLKWSVTAWNKLVNMDFLRSGGLLFEPGLVHEDNLWSLQLAATARSMAVVRKVTYSRYVRPGSIITSTDMAKELVVTERCLYLMHLYAVSQGLQDSYGVQIAMGSMMSNVGRRMRDEGCSGMAARRAVDAIDPRSWAEGLRFALHHPKGEAYVHSYLLPMWLRRGMKRLVGSYVPERETKTDMRVLKQL